MAAGGGSGSSSGAIRAGRAFVEISADDKGVTAVLDRLKAKFVKFGAGMAKIGAGLSLGGGAVLAPLIGLFTQAVEKGSQWNDLADKLGTSTEHISALGYAGEQAGVGIETLSAGISKMQATIGGGGLVNGFDLSSLNGQDIETQLASIATLLDSVASADDRVALARGIFGRGGAEMLPMLKGGGDALQKMTAEAREFGLVYSSLDAERADKIGDGFHLMWRAIKGIASSVGKAILPFAEELDQFTKMVAKNAVAVKDFVKENSTLIVTIAAVAGGVVAAGTAIAAVGGAIALVGIGIGGLVTAAGALSAVFAAIVSPIGLIVGGLAAVAASVGYLLYNFTSLGEIFETTWGGIAAAIKKGDLSAAMNIAWLGIKLVFHTGVAWLKEIWIGFTSFFAKAWEAVTTGWAVGFVKALEVIDKAAKSIGVDLGINTEGWSDKILEESRAAMAQIDADREARIAEANAAANGTRAELEAAIAAAKAVTAKTEQKAKGTVALAALAKSGPVRGAFGGNLSQSLAFGDGGNKIEKNTERTAKASEEMAKALVDAPPLVWGV